jgi:uncharacterized protein DUF5335
LNTRVVTPEERSMSIRRLDRREWQGFCIRMSHNFIGKRVAIEVASLDFGAQRETERLPLLGMSYDPRSDVFELIVGELDHLIYGPREVYVDESPLIDSIILQIIDAAGVRQIVTLRDPLMLPSPDAAR